MEKSFEKRLVYLTSEYEEINEYLVQVNQRIEKRGQRIVNRL